MVYDIGEKRVNKILKIGRKYLNWIQNSVFEGEITNANFKKMKSKINSEIDDELDSVVFFKFKSIKLFKKEILGKDKNPISEDQSYMV